jgi:WD40 repeat protein
LGLSFSVNFASLRCFNTIR